MPCDVFKVVNQHCLLCHGVQPAFGAPMSLATARDFAAASLSQPAVAVHTLAKLRIHSEASPMPPVSQPRMSAAELAMLDTWLDRGAPESTETCDTETGARPGKSASAFDWSQCAYDVSMLAHGGQGVPDDSGYATPLEDDHYECFNFTAPWSGQVQGIKFQSIIDDARVLHHWILYQVDASDPPAPGTHGDCAASRTYLSAWVPGNEGEILPDDVGLQLPPGGTPLQLEIHYNNTGRYRGVSDRSGVRVCAIDKLRKHTAGIHQLGTLPLLVIGPSGTTEVSNTCLVASDLGDAHVLSSMPHMHKLGTRLSTIVTRQDGRDETLIDTPFDFHNQATHATPMIVHPGDLLTTTCTWNNTTNQTVGYGEGTGDEMCYNYVIAWPVGALSSGLLGMTCIGPTPI